MGDGWGENERAVIWDEGKVWWSNGGLKVSDCKRT